MPPKTSDTERVTTLDKFLDQEPDTITLEAYKRRESGESKHALPLLARKESMY